MLKRKLHTKAISIILCTAIAFNMLFTVPTAQAYTTVALPNWVTEIADFLTGIYDYYTNYKQLTDTVSKWVKENANAIIINSSKVAALYTVQAITRAIIGESSSGNGGGVVGDWRTYLIIAPQQRAMTQMNSFFNTVSRGRLSTLSYEGIGPNYDAYLVAQAKLAINGQSFSTNLQDIVTDPRQMFSGGNMKGLMTYMQCANNVACYTLTSQNQYATELASATIVAEREQDRGFLPVKKNGKIVQPASIVFNSLSQVDQLGTNLIMSTSTGDQLSAALSQIATGTTISIAARSFQYTVADKNQKKAIQNKNDQAPVYSFSYNSANGFGVNVNGKALK